MIYIFIKFEKIDKKGFRFDSRQNTQLKNMCHNSKFLETSLLELMDEWMNEWMNETPFSSIVTPFPPNNAGKTFRDSCFFRILKKGEEDSTPYEGRGKNSQLGKIWWQFSFVSTTFVHDCECFVFQEKVSKILVLPYTRTQIKHILLILRFCNRRFGDRRRLSVDEKRDKSLFRLLPLNLNFAWFLEKFARKMQTTL